MFQVAAQINGVQYNPSKPIANPSSTATGAAGSVSVTSSSLNGGLNTVATSLVS